MWIDNHCHLPADNPALAAELVAGAAEAGVQHLINVGCDLQGSIDALAVASAFDNVWATAGVHPHDASQGCDGLRDLIGSNRLVAIGECGLDHFYDHSDPAAQRLVFAEQIALANEFGLPLVIHTREAWDETFEILDAEGIPARTVFHCFTGGPAEAEACLERGALLSFSGILTFPSAGELRDAALMCPLERMMVETDAPYLAPVPHRGRPNRPALVAVVGAAMAELRGVAPEVVAEATSSNALAFYGLSAAAGA